MSAAGYAAHRSSVAPDDWWRLEAAAFRGEDRVRDALAMTAPRHLALTLRGERRGAGRWQRALAVPKVALIIGSLTLTAIWGLPVFGTILMGGGTLAVGTYGVVATVSALLGLLPLFSALRDRGGERGPVVVWLARAVPAWLGAGAALVWLGSGAAVHDSLAFAAGVPVTGAWVIPMVADALVSLALVLLARSGGRGAPTLRTERSVARLTEAVAALPAARRDEIALDLRTAIDTLERAGAISAADARRARAAHPGELGATMAPERVEA